MTKATDPYSRVYWRVRSDPKFVGIYADDHHFAAWVRLLIAADAAWPAPADVPASCRRASLRALTAAGLIDLFDSGLYRVHGLDAERGKRQSVAVTAATARWTDEQPESNAAGPREHPPSNADGMPRARSEPSRAELSQAQLPESMDDDLWALYAGLTRTPARKPATLDWLERLETTYGVGPSALALREEHAKDPNPGTLLSRTNARLEAAARKAENGTATRKRQERVTSEVVARRLDEFHFTGKWREEWGIQPAEVPA